MMLRDLVRQGLELFHLIPLTEISAAVRPTRPAADDLRQDQLVIVRGKIDKWALMRCPCGCGERIQLSLARARRPRWRIEVDHLGRPTVAPSVRIQGGCQAHFHLRCGRVEWCGDTGN